MHIERAIAQNEGAGGGAPHLQNVCLDSQFTDSRFPTPGTSFKGFHRPKSVNRDENHFGAHFGPLALAGTAPKIFCVIGDPPPTYLPSFVPIGLAVVWEMRFGSSTASISRYHFCLMAKALRFLTVHPHFQCFFLFNHPEEVAGYPRGEYIKQTLTI